MKPTHDRLPGEGRAGCGAPDMCHVGAGAHLRGRLWDVAWASHTCALAVAQVAHGGPRPEVSTLIRHKLHSMRVGENLGRPHRYAVSPTKS